MFAPINYTASATLTAYEANAVTTVNAAAGLTLTLPAATGTGRRYDIILGTTVTSNSVIIKVASATDWMAGNIWVATDNASDVTIAFETATGALASRSDTITLNGTTTGGVAGDRFTLIDLASGQWGITGWTSATGTEVTPFSAAV